MRTGRKNRAKTVFWIGAWGAALSFVALLSPAVPMGWMLATGVDPNDSVPAWLTEYMARATGAGVLGLIAFGILNAVGFAILCRRGEF